jgi:hypothetical protein
MGLTYVRAIDSWHSINDLAAASLRPRRTFAVHEIKVTIY